MSPFCLLLASMLCLGHTLPNCFLAEPCPLHHTLFPGGPRLSLQPKYSFQMANPSLSASPMGPLLLAVRTHLSSLSLFPHDL